MFIRVLFLLLIAQNIAQAQYKNLVFEGGGINGTAYAGALSVLEEKGKLKDVENVLGTSSGAIVGMMIALGYNSHEIDSLTLNIDIKKFDDRKGGWVGKLLAVKKNWGGSPGIFLYEYLQDRVKQKTGNPLLTFWQLDSLTKIDKRFKNLYCVVTNLGLQKTEVLSRYFSPNMPIAMAVRASASIPFYFEPVSVDKDYNWIKDFKNKEVSFYVDGGIASNFLLEYFDSCNNENNYDLHCISPKPNMETIGFKLERDNQQKQAWLNNDKIAAFEISDFKSYTNSVLNMIMETMNRKHPMIENERNRTIYIPIGKTEATIRKMSLEEKKKKFEDSKLAAEKFLSLSKNTLANK